MLFNSTEFLIFFGLFLILYWWVRGSLRYRNGLILGASYWFYGSWDVRFLGLLLFSSGFDYWVAGRLDACSSPRGRKALLLGSVLVNLGILFTFKYFGFFRESLALLLARMGVDVAWNPILLTLPVGISFYTFQSLGYAIDVFHRRVKPERDVVAFLSYVAFFPQLVAGPIERATHLLPQFKSARRIDAESFHDGFTLMLVGLFKKVCLADNLAPMVSLVFERSPELSLPLLVMGGLAFGLQIYCDFAGYSDVARGAARMLGFDLRLNFRLPYLACDLQDFWRRWHISLSSWLRDYVYIPLGGNRGGHSRTAVNLLVVMFLGGLWHGASANFALWGFWHGAGLVVVFYWLRDRRPEAGKGRPLWRRLVAWGATFLFVSIGWVLFRANSPELLWKCFAGLPNWTVPRWAITYLRNLTVLGLPLLLLEIWQVRARSMEPWCRLKEGWRAMFAALLMLLVGAYWNEEAPEFIYFQF